MGLAFKQKTLFVGLKNENVQCAAWLHVFLSKTKESLVLRF